MASLRPAPVLFLCLSFAAAPAFANSEPPEMFPASGAPGPALGPQPEAPPPVPIPGPVPAAEGRSPVLTQPPAVPDAVAAAEYEQRHVGFFKVPVPSTYAGSEAGRWAGPFLGNQEHPLNPGEFFAAVDRPDLARAYTKRTRVRKVLIISGVTLMAAGLATTLLGAMFNLGDSTCTSTDQYGNCNYDYAPNYPVLGAGIGAFSVGLAAWIVGMAMQRTPIPNSDFPELAVKHNRRLRRQLGLPDLKDADADIPESVQKKAPISLHLTSDFSATGGTVGLALAY